MFLSYIWTRIVALACKVNSGGDLFITKNIPFKVKTLAIENDDFRTQENLDKKSYVFEQKEDLDKIDCVLEKEYEKEKNVEYEGEIRAIEEIDKSEEKNNCNYEQAERKDNLFDINRKRIESSINNNKNKIKYKKKRSKTTKKNYDIQEIDEEIKENDTIEFIDGDKRILGENERLACRFTY